MNRREFNAAALAAVLWPHLEREGDSRDPYADFEAFEKWWASIEYAVNTDTPLYHEGIELDLSQRISLYSALCDWLKAQETPA